MKNKIRQCITEKGLKIMFIIEKVGLSTSSFYEIMNGKAVPSLKNARKIAEVLEVSLDELFPNYEENK